MNLKAQEFLATHTDEEIAKLYRDVFSTWNAQIVLQDLQNRAHFYTPCFDEESTSPQADRVCIHNDGKRSILLHIDTMMRLMPQPPKTQEEKNGE